MRVPKYRIRPDRNVAFVEVNGSRITLPGPANSDESKEAYGRVIADYFRRHPKKRPLPLRPAWEISISEVAAAWLEHCRTYYALTANTRSNEYDNCRHAIRPLLALFADCPAVRFSPVELKAAREAMIDGSWKNPKARPWSRRYINSSIGRIKRMLRWGVENQIVSPEVSAIIAAMAPIKRGRTAAEDRHSVKPVAVETVETTLPYMPPVVAAMVRIQQLTGMRSGNVCSLRPCDIERSGDIWLYEPSRHKTAHYDKCLTVLIGPTAQAVLSPFLDRKPTACCFSPREVGRYAARRIGRRIRGVQYTTNSYRNAVHRAIRKANKARTDAARKAGLPVPPPIPLWHPHQLRHLRTEQVKKAGGLEAARAYLGHSSVRTTEIYDSRDLDLARQIALAIG